MIKPDDLMFVERRERHWFDEVTEELALAGFFAPPEGSAPG
jgi:hypothetical protein